MNNAISTSPSWTLGGTDQASAPTIPEMTSEDFRGFYEATAKGLWGYLMRLTGDRELASDLVQESYLRLLKANFRPQSEAHRKNYLYKIGTNLTTDHFRAQKWRAEPLGDYPSGTRMGKQVEIADDLGRALEALKPRDRQVLWLAHVEGFRHTEIAEVLGIKAKSVRLILFRARKRLAAILRRKGIGPEVLT